ncbi:hypothetical protein EJ02DRAFT_458991 [Clathrospora elynae]|uniref:Uncharacterized protein n=1 Tax=Clathrospora elynae TaxID=706981 RepID=A0A6A5SAU8_9PLEO|nr:hypothetical protein EJ02DRAFT_458991 [Clathrospora elynae]
MPTVEEYLQVLPEIDPFGRRRIAQNPLARIELEDFTPIILPPASATASATMQRSDPTTPAEPASRPSSLYSSVATSSRKATTSPTSPATPTSNHIYGSETSERTGISDSLAETMATNEFVGGPHMQNYPELGKRWNHGVSTMMRRAAGEEKERVRRDSLMLQELAKLVDGPAAVRDNEVESGKKKRSFLQKLF